MPQRPEIGACVCSRGAGASLGSLRATQPLPNARPAPGGSCWGGDPAAPGNPWSFAGCLPGTGERWLVVRDVRVGVNTRVGCVGRCVCTEEACVGLCWMSALKRLVLAGGFCKCVLGGWVGMRCEYRACSACGVRVLRGACVHPRAVLGRARCVSASVASVCVSVRVRVSESVCVGGEICA